MREAIDEEHVGQVMVEEILPKGEMSVGQLAEKLKVSPVTIFRVTDALHKKGAVQVKERNGRHFVSLPERPDAPRPRSRGRTMEGAGG